MDDGKIRCDWPNTELYIRYHDEEWGTPIHDDQKLFEFLILEGAQAGLSWITILKKRENYRKAFDHFNAEKIARYGEKEVNRLLEDPGIIRNKLKIHGAIQNAQAFLKVQDEYGSFDRYLWDFMNGKTIHNQWKTIEEIPAKTNLSDKISKDMKKRGFKFFGSTICYSHMQATGMINDHIVCCFRYNEICELC